jgi:hypothetical protein
MESGKESGVDGQRFAIGGRVVDADDPQLQDLLAQAYEAPGRPRCLCVAGGVEMYVAFHRHFQIKRMPETGDRHHPACPSYEPGPAMSGLGELVGEAVVQLDPARVELHVDFPWARVPGRAGVSREPAEPSEVGRTRRRMSLRALMHFLFERAGFNRWSPAMAGKRNQAVLHKYLMQAAEAIQVKGESLSNRLYVPEAFNESAKAEQAERRRARLSVLQPHDGRQPLAVVLGEFKGWESTPAGARIWIRHMPDAPLLADARTWARVQRGFAPLFEALDSDGGRGLRLMLAALIRARREHTYEIDLASLMLTSEEWIPLEGVHEAPLVRALVSQGRRFVKPMRYDARSVAGFANAILLDVGAPPVDLHVVSGFMGEAEQGAKRRAFENARPRSWLWLPGEAMPVLPGPSTRLTAGAAACRPHAGPTTVRPNPAGRDPG